MSLWSFLAAEIEGCWSDVAGTSLLATQPSQGPMGRLWDLAKPPLVSPVVSCLVDVTGEPPLRFLRACLTQVTSLMLVDVAEVRNTPFLAV